MDLPLGRTDDDDYDYDYDYGDDNDLMMMDACMEMIC